VGHIRSATGEDHVVADPKAIGQRPCLGFGGTGANKQQPGSRFLPENLGEDREQEGVILLRTKYANVADDEGDSR
jgi:hypothetical protein